jgi:hypothetical protein
MKTALDIVLLVIILCSLLFSSCDENCKETKYELNESIVINICPKPKTNNIVKYYEVYEFFVPKIFENHLDTIIELEKKCYCYKENITGFMVSFSNVSDDSVSISIVSLDAIQVNDYSDFSGFFLYKDHYFACLGNDNNFPIDIKRRIMVFAYMPLPEMPEIYDGWSQYYFLYANDKLETNSHYPCIKKK